MAIWSAEIKELKTLYTSIKDLFPGLEKELGHLIKTDDSNVILLYSRRCLEIIITELCECELKRERGNEPLKGIIDKLNKEKKVPSHIVASMQNLNTLSTFGTHPKDFDPEQVKPVLINLDIIIKWYLKYKGQDIKVQREEKIQIPQESSEEVTKQVIIEQQEKPIRLSSLKIISAVLITAILLIAGIINYPKIFKRDTLEILRSSGERISVAVMPFQNLTNDTVWNIWQDGIQNELITSLTSSEKLKVRQAESINDLIQSKGKVSYASLTPSVASNISQKLDANIFIFGSIKQAGLTIRLNAQLIDTKTEELLRSFQIEGPSREENIFHIIDTLSAMIKNFLVISELKKQMPIDYQYIASTSSPEAYRYYIYGQNAFNKRDFTTAAKLFSEAISIDSNFYDAALQLIYTYGNQDSIYQAKEIFRRISEKKDRMPLEMKIKMDRVYAMGFETPNEEIKYMKQSLEFDDQAPRTYWSIGEAYNRIFQYDKAIPELEKALSLYEKWELKPMWIFNYTELGYAYHMTGIYDKEKLLYRKAGKDFPDDLELIYRQAVLSLTVGDTTSANSYIDKYIHLLNDNLASESTKAIALARIFLEAGSLSKAEKYYRKAVSIEHDNSALTNNLAYFLIDRDLNLEEGLQLAENALALKPDNYNLLHTKGLGLYKQGKYREALKFLQKSDSLKPYYNHELFLHLEAAKKAVAGININ